MPERQREEQTVDKVAAERDKLLLDKSDLEMSVQNAKADEEMRLRELRDAAMQSLRGIQGVASVDDDLPHEQLLAKLDDIYRRASAMQDWLKS